MWRLREGFSPYAVGQYFVFSISVLWSEDSSFIIFMAG